jgi:hypothetical protein
MGEEVIKLFRRSRCRLNKHRKEIKMKHKTCVVVVLVLFVFLVGEVSAAAPKPPTKICFSTTAGSTPLLLALMVKSVGSMPMANGSTNFYGINGFVFSTVGQGPWNYPVIGTGHMLKDNVGVFHFSITGSTAFSAAFFMANLEGYWDTVDKTGFLWGNIAATVPSNTTDVNVTGASTSPLVEVTCGSVEIAEPPSM